jgi:hypothetical protein
MAMKECIITPREFTRLWNLLLANTRKGISGGNNLPKTIMSIDKDGVDKHKLVLVISRLNDDPEFTQEFVSLLGKEIQIHLDDSERDILISIRYKYDEN